MGLLIILVKEIQGFRTDSKLEMQGMKGINEP